MSHNCSLHWQTAGHTETISFSFTSHLIPIVSHHSLEYFSLHFHLVLASSSALFVPVYHQSLYLLFVILFIILFLILIRFLLVFGIFRVSNPSSYYFEFFYFISCIFGSSGFDFLHHVLTDLVLDFLRMTLFGLSHLFGPFTPCFAIPHTDTDPATMDLFLTTALMDFLIFHF